MPTPTELSRAIKREALRLGFHMAGVTTPDPPASLPRYKEWLAAGYHGEMAYLATERAVERRADPRLILSECRSVLVLAVRYPRPEPPEARPDRGQIAAYARNQDYHEVLKPRLAALVAFIEEQIGAPLPNRWYTDSGPLLERELGQRAGLGWIGKNSMLINPKQGSYFLLAEILLGIELPPDPPFNSDHCGSCSRCLDACPTQCITGERTIDARRCISYLTIELKGAIPVELRPGLGDWLFGCDVCQQVCPWNMRFAPSEGEPAFAPRPQTSLPQPGLELALTPQEFNRKFKGSPLKRSKRRGYLRNAAVVLGNQGGAGAVSALTASLQNEPEPLVRRHAAWALGQIGGETALQALRQAQGKENQQEVCEEIKNALAQIGQG